MREKRLRIKGEFEKGSPEEMHSFYVQAIEKILNQVCPCEEEGEFQMHLPLISWTPLIDPPSVLTLKLCCLSRPHAFHFFYEMISRWLIPGKRLDILLQFALHFSIPGFS